MRLSDFVHVAPRYVRSVNIARDLGQKAALDGYVITSSVYGVLGRVIESLRDPSGQRAWSITGPYGSGKSALGLLLARVLESPKFDLTVEARQLLCNQWPEAAQQFFRGNAGNRLSKSGYVVVPLSGARESLAHALIRAACQYVRQELPGVRKLETVRRIVSLNDRSFRGEQLTSTEVVEAVTAASRQLSSDGHALGIVILIDELGKFLEFAAQQPDQSDVFLLQQLAEAAVPTAGNHLAVISILHQSFERYAAMLGPAARSEWAKVQGRFEDVAFVEPPDAVLGLLRAAIQHTDKRIGKSLRQQAKPRAERLFDLGLCPPEVNRNKFVEMLTGCAPLHPLAALALIRLSRKFGQNQRSVFSFLTSREPHGLAEFLGREISTTGEFPPYGLADLFDYTSTALGDALSQGEASGRWSAAQAVVDRAAGCSPREVSLLKSVGLLSAVGAHGKLASTPEVLRTAFDVETGPFEELDSLVARSLLVERRYNGTVGLWDGSDLDIEERLREAALRLPESLDIAGSIASFWLPRPAVAKHHSFRYGTLRYFDAVVADGSNLMQQAALGSDADGRIVYLFPADPAEAEAMEVSARTISESEPMLVFAIAARYQSLRSSLREDQLLGWVEANTPELQSDAVARRELRTRRSWVRSTLQKQIEDSIAPGSGARWICDGEVQVFATQRHLSARLTLLCDRVFYQTPVLHNELVNRRNLSSAAAAARRNVLAAMLQSPHKEQLGFTGSPPEVAIYRSVLKATGLHRCEDGTWGFHPPSGSDSLYQVWKRIEKFLDDSAEAKRPVAELFATLQERPYGMKAGVLPILFASVVAVYGTELALYDDGVFTPALTIEALERLVRHPAKFHVRQYRMEGLHRQLFRQLALVLKAGSADAGGSADLIEIMRPLYAMFNRLPPYTRTTRRLSSQALAVRAALADAREPDTLLLRDLPRACGVLLEDSADSDVVELFVGRFRQALQEMDEAYAKLLEELTDSLLRIFDAPTAGAREILRERAMLVLPSASDVRLRAFCINLSEDSADAGQWIEAIATMVVGKAPRIWNDTDKAKYDVTLPDLVRTFRHVLAVTAERQVLRSRGLSGRVMRLGVTESGAGSLEELVTIYTSDEPEIARIVIEIEEILGKASPQRRAALAALGMVLKNRLDEADSAHPAVAEHSGSAGSRANG